MSHKIDDFNKSHNFINYNNVITDNKHTSQSYRRKSYNIQKKKQDIIPINNFNQFFKNVKPSLKQQLKNIFCQTIKPQLFKISNEEDNQYIVQGSLLTTRTRSLRKSKDLQRQSNNFTLDSIDSSQICKKAKLNQLVRLRQNLLQRQLKQSDLSKIIRQSGRVIQQYKIQKNKKKKIEYSPQILKMDKIDKKIMKQLLITKLNPRKCGKFTNNDLIQSILQLHEVNIQNISNISYFNIYVEQGNNSQLIKSLVRKRNGWRVVEIPQIANFIWTQFYRSSILKKRLHKRQKTQIEDIEQNQRSFNLRHSNSITKYEKLSKQEQTKNIAMYVKQLKKLIPQIQIQQIYKLKSISDDKCKQIIVGQNILIHNHFPQNKCISDKRHLLNNLSNYYNTKGQNVFQIVPQSYQIQDINNPIITKLQQQNVQEWIIKPGQNSNRGRGIIITHSSQQLIQKLTNLFQINESLQVKKIKKKPIVVIQKYIMPLLYHGRKFDIRSYMLITYLNGYIKMYCYQQCYIRTSSKMFNIKSQSKMVHLTNDAIQSQSHDYGRFQQGNKISQTLFAKYIDQQYGKTNENKQIWKQIKLQMENRCLDVVKSSKKLLLKNCESKQQIFYYQLFGMDFMIDHQYKLWLIQVNTNPAITHDCSKVLNILIPKMLDNMLCIAVQPIMRPVKCQQLVINNQFIAKYSSKLLEQQNTVI